MTIFSYAAYDPSGRTVEGEIEAASAAVAAELLHKRGLIAFRTVQLAGGRRRAAGANAAFGRASALSLGELADFSRQLATLLRAELPLDQCLRLVASQSARGRSGQLADRLAEEVIAGAALSEAMARALPAAPAFIASLIRAGEARGTLTAAFGELARILERRVEVRARVRSALVYPAVLLVVALATIALVVGVLVPTLMPLFRDSGKEPPAALALADAIARLLTDQWPAVLGGGGLAIAGLVWIGRRQAVRAGVERVLLRLPLVGPLIVANNVAMLSGTLGTLLRNGVPLVAALDLAATVVSGGRFRASLQRAAQSVKEGGKLAPALQRDPIYPEMAVRFVTIGEESSKLDDMLLHLADVTGADSQRRIDTLLTLFTPALTLVVGLVIGGLILTVMQAVLGVNEIALQ